MDQGTALSCEPIAEKFAETGESFVVTAARSGKTAARPDQTCANFVRIGATALRSKSYGRIVVKSEAINAKFVATAVSFVRIEAICGETVATSGTTGAMLGTRIEHR